MSSKLEISTPFCCCTFVELQKDAKRPFIMTQSAAEEISVVAIDLLARRMRRLPIPSGKDC